MCALSIHQVNRYLLISYGIPLLNRAANLPNSSSVPNKHHFSNFTVITSLAKEVMFLVALVSLSVCLFVCGQHYSKSYERIEMKFYGGVLSSTRKN